MIHLLKAIAEIERRWLEVPKSVLRDLNKAVKAFEKLTEPRMVSFHAEGNSAEMTLTAAKGVLGRIAEAMSVAFDGDGGTNYVQYEFATGDRAFTLVLQKTGMKSPHQFRKEAEAERDAAVAQVENITNLGRQLIVDSSDARVDLAEAVALLKRWLDDAPGFEGEPAKSTRDFLKGEKTKTRDTVLEAQQRTCEHEYKVQVGERVLCRNCTAEVA